MDNAALVAPNPNQIQPSAIQSRFARLSPRGRVMLAAGAAALIALVSVTWLWSSAPSYGILFTNLSDQDGGAIIAQLAQMNIPYRNADGGAILVPADRVHEARLKLATQGLPKGSLVGFELLENQHFGVTQFQEQINYQRGLEGELARSIQSLSPVATARVHLALPKQSGFLRDHQAPTASVLLQMRAGQTLDRTQVAGIVHLVASSVPELIPKNVSVVDQYGNLLASQNENAAGLDAAQLDYVAQIENAAIKRIEDILEPIVGRGNVRARVTADIDFTQVEQMAETYKPNQAAESGSVRSQTSLDSSQPGPANPGGVPGALSNQPPVPATAPINGAAPPLNPGATAQSGNSTRKELTTNYEVDKNVRQVKSPSGQIKRLTAAVVVNQRMLPVAAPEPVAPPVLAPGAKPTADKTPVAAPVAAAPKLQSTPLTAQEMQDIQALVQQALGYSKERGDSVNVVNAAFSPSDNGDSDALPLWKQPEMIALGKEGGKALLFLLLAMIVVFGAVRPALKAFAVREEIESAEQAKEEAAAAVAELAAPEETPAAVPGPTPMDLVREDARANPLLVANVVKAWIGEGK